MNKEIDCCGAFVIFDRDGTLIDHVHHLVNPDDVTLKLDLGVALKMLNHAKFQFGIVTNQSVIGRGLATKLQVERVNDMVVNFAKDLGLRFDFVYFCPHLPGEGCNCRKPSTGLGRKAILHHGLNPRRSFVIGDQESDLLFGKNLGCRTIQLLGGSRVSKHADYHAETLLDAAKWIVKNSI